MSRNDIILAVFAAILVGFSFVVSLVIPRREPGFPGRKLRLFGVVAALLVVAMLAAVEVFGESHDFSEGHGEETVAEGGVGGEGATTTAEGGSGTTTGGGEPAGDPAAGSQVFAAQGCGSCHTLEEANATGQVGPDLDEGLQGEDPASIKSSIVDPDAEVTEGYAPGVMPANYEQQLSPEELANLVSFLQQATQG